MKLFIGKNAIITAVIKTAVRKTALRKEVDLFEDVVDLTLEGINAGVVVNNKIAVLSEEAVGLLRGYTLFSRIGSYAVTGNDTAYTYVLVGYYSDYLIAVAVKARFKELGCVYDSKSVACLLAGNKPAVYCFNYVLMCDAVERRVLDASLFLVGFAKYYTCKSLSVKTAVGKEDILAEVFHKLAKTGLARLADLTGDLIGVEAFDAA